MSLLKSIGRKMILSNCNLRTSIGPNKCASLNKHAPWLLTFAGCISATIQPISTKFSAFVAKVFQSSDSVFHWNRTSLWSVFCLRARHIYSALRLCGTWIGERTLPEKVESSGACLAYVCHALISCENLFMLRQRAVREPSHNVSMSHKVALSCQFVR